MTISTCHAAKGLEWPVVIVPAGVWFYLKLVIMLMCRVVEQGIFPFYRADDVEEERCGDLTRLRSLC